MTDQPQRKSETSVGAPSEPSFGENAERSLREAHSRSVAKAVSWRLTGTADTFVVSLFVTGKVTIAGSIALTEFLTKIVLYYGHERVWGRVRWGKR